MGTVNSACIRSDSNRKMTSSIGEPLKGHKSPSREVRKSSKSDNFWDGNTLDMDNSAAQAGGNYSAFSTAHQSPDVSGPESGNIPSEFVNHVLRLANNGEISRASRVFASSAGFLLWNQSRQQWVGNKNSGNRGTELEESRLSWTATYESLLTTNKRFTKPIPLPEMVDFLVEIWEQEGMYN